MKRHNRYIRFCLKKAKQNDIDNYKHCAVLVKGNRILSVGLNSNKAGCLVDPLYDKKGVHAELDALCKLSEDQIKGSTLYVAGWSRGNHVVTSKPCPYCQEYLKKFDIKAVYYSTPTGGYEEMII